jgi:hypothetical protein
MKNYTLAQKLVVIMMIEFYAPTLQPNPSAPSRECDCPLPFGITKRSDNFVGFTFQEAVAVLNNLDHLLLYPIKEWGSVLKDTVLVGICGKGNIASPGASCYRLTEEKPAALSATLWSQLVNLYHVCLIVGGANLDLRFDDKIGSQVPQANGAAAPIGRCYKWTTDTDDVAYPERLMLWSCHGPREMGESLYRRFGALVWRLVFHPKLQALDEVSCKACFYDLLTRLRLESKGLDEKSYKERFRNLLTRIRLDRQERLAALRKDGDDQRGDVPPLESGTSLFPSAGMRPPPPGEDPRITGFSMISGQFGPVLIPKEFGPIPPHMCDALNRGAEQWTARTEAAAVAAGCRPMPPMEVTSVRPNKGMIQASRWTGEILKKANKVDIMRKQYQALWEAGELYNESGPELTLDEICAGKRPGFAEATNTVVIDTTPAGSGAKVGGMNRREARNAVRKKKKDQKQKPVVNTERINLENVLLGPVVIEPTTVTTPPAEEP